jgi:hypothetical protein
MLCILDPAVELQSVALSDDRLYAVACIAMGQKI